MKITTIPVGHLDTNCYLVEENKQIMMIDPGDNAPLIKSFLNDIDGVLKLIVLTHFHYDHVMAANQFGVPIFIHSDDVDGLANSKASQDITPVILGDSIDINGLKFDVIHTPGHTPGSVSLYTTGHLFSGDTLFFETVGIHQPSVVTQMRQSVMKLLQLPKETIVYPGHGPTTTIQHEITHGYYR